MSSTSKLLFSQPLSPQGASAKPSAAPPSPSPAPSLAPAPALPLVSVNTISDPLKFNVKNVNYQADILLRRLKVWRASKGFTNPKAPFSVKTLQNFFRRISFEEGANGDKIITALPLALLDVSSASGQNVSVGWTEVLQLLRDCEKIAGSAEPRNSSSMITLEVTCGANEPLELELWRYEEFDELGAKIASLLKQRNLSLSPDACASALRAQGNPHQKTIEFLVNELGTCQDVILNLEKTMLEHRVAAMQSSAAGRGVLDDCEDELACVDTDADGKITKEEWRKWMSEKLSLIASHNSKLEELVRLIVNIYSYAVVHI